jgi:hypothetical protein
MKTIAIIAAILFSMSLKSQIVYRGVIEQTFVWANEDWAKKDSALGELRRIDLDEKSGKFTVLISQDIKMDLIIDKVQFDEETGIMKVFGRDEKFFPILFEYEPNGTQAALYYYWSNEAQHFRKSELLVLNEINFN